MRKITNLNFDWKYSAIFEESMLEENYNHKSFETVAIPHTNVELPLNNFDEKDTCIISCYRKEIKLSKEECSNINMLEFDGVSSYAEVYVNGQYVGNHKGGYTSFKFDISQYVKVGKNIIAVKCDSTEREDIPPFGHVVDYLVYGGIYREVRLINLKNCYIENAFIKCDNIYEDNKQFDVNIKLHNQEQKQISIVAKAYYKGIEVAKTEIESSEQNINLSATIKNAILWDVKTPMLYQIVISLYNGILKLDEMSYNFGFRECKFKNDGFYLNGKKIKIRGLNRHQSYAYVGYAMPKSMQVEDARFLKKDLCVNLVRTSHYPQSQHFFNACDELGLLVFTEAPGWQHIGGDEFKKNYLVSVREMIEQNYNHPSIILWGVRVNESQDDDELYKESNKIAHELDSTRQTGGVRNFGGSTLFEDVYTYNDFLHDGYLKPLEKPAKITKKKQGVPYLVSEHNGHMFPTKRYDQEKKRVEHALRHARVLNAMYGDQNISGCIGWCMSDYNTHKDFGSGDKICYHGVSDIFRIPKLASAIYASQGEKPYLMPSTDMAFGDYDGTFMGGHYVFTNCDEVRLFRNDRLIDSYLPKGQALSNLPHPAIFIPDSIGNTMAEDGVMKPKDCEKLKKVFRYVADFGLNRLKLRHKLTIAWLLFKYKMSMAKGQELFLTYLSNWGDEQSVYEFIGYNEGREVCKSTLSSTKQRVLDIQTTSTILDHEETYDVALVRLTLRNQNNSLLTYAFDGIKLQTSGAITVIGGENQALIGGALGIYVKSENKGHGTLTITCGNLEEKIDFYCK